MRAKQIRREEISPKEIICLLNEYARDLDFYEFGLPVYSDAELDKMITIVNNWLKKDASMKNSNLQNIHIRRSHV